MDKEQQIIKLQTSSDPFEKGTIIDALLLAKSFSIKTIAERMGITQAYVCHYMRMSKIPQVVRDGYYDELISQSHLIILSRLKTEHDMIDAYEKIISESFTTLQLEAYVREKLYGVKSIGKYLTDYDKEQLTYNLHKMLRPSSIQIIQSRTKGRVVIEFKGSLVVTSALIRKLFEQIDNSTSTK